MSEKNALARKVEAEDMEIRRRLGEIESRLMQMTGCRTRLTGDKRTLRESLERSLVNVERIRDRILTLGKIESKTIEAVHNLEEETRVYLLYQQEHQQQLYLQEQGGKT